MTKDTSVNDTVLFSAFFQQRHDSVSRSFFTAFQEGKITPMHDTSKTDSRLEPPYGGSSSGTLYEVQFIGVALLCPDIARPIDKTTESPTNKPVNGVERDGGVISATYDADQNCSGAWSVLVRILQVYVPKPYCLTVRVAHESEISHKYHSGPKLKRFTGTSFVFVTLILELTPLLFLCGLWSQKLHPVSPRLMPWVSFCALSSALPSSPTFRPVLLTHASVLSATQL